jgi:peptide/nickel transport system ATP-binding protein
MHSFPTVSGERQELHGIPGSPPTLINPPTGCRFHPRCDLMIAGVCPQIVPTLREVAPRHQAACHLLEREDVR